MLAARGPCVPAPCTSSSSWDPGSSRRQGGHVRCSSPGCSEGPGCPFLEPLTPVRPARGCLRALRLCPAALGPPPTAAPRVSRPAAGLPSGWPMALLCRDACRVTGVPVTLSRPSLEGLWPRPGLTLPSPPLHSAGCQCLGLSCLQATRASLPLSSPGPPGPPRPAPPPPAAAPWGRASGPAVSPPARHPRPAILPCVSPAPASQPGGKRGKGAGTGHRVADVGEEGATPRPPSCLLGAYAPHVIAELAEKGWWPRPPREMLRPVTGWRDDATPPPPLGLTCAEGDAVSCDWIEGRGTTRLGLTCAECSFHL